METNAMLALCLPTRMGGWSLKIPVVNKSVRASKRMQRYVDGAMYTPDFTWTREVDGKIIRITGEYGQMQSRGVTASRTRFSQAVLYHS